MSRAERAASVCLVCGASAGKAEEVCPLTTEEGTVWEDAHRIAPTTSRRRLHLPACWCPGGARELDDQGRCRRCVGRPE